MSPNGKEARAACYLDVVGRLEAAEIPYLVGGAFALAHYTALDRETKDLDLFIMARDRDRLLETMRSAGYETRVQAPHWLAKVLRDGELIDVIYNSGNGICAVDAEWFQHTEPGRLYDHPVPIGPPEEAIWSKAFIMERERFDAADVAHIIHARGRRLDWPRLLRRFGEQWQVLLAHLVLFTFIYPRERDAIPAWVLQELLERLRRELEAEPNSHAPECRGTLLSRQFLPDIRVWGYKDARLPPTGTMSPREIAHWVGLFPDSPGAEQPRPS